MIEGDTLQTTEIKKREDKDNKLKKKTQKKHLSFKTDDMLLTCASKVNNNNTVL